MVKFSCVFSRVLAPKSCVVTMRHATQVHHTLRGAYQFSGEPRQFSVAKQIFHQPRGSPHMTQQQWCLMLDMADSPTPLETQFDTRDYTRPRLCQ